MINGVDLGQELEGFVRELASSDRFVSVDAVLRESVRMLEARERKLAEFNTLIEEGYADLRAGRIKPAEEVFDQLRKRLSADLDTR